MEQIITSLSQSLNLPDASVRAGVGVLLSLLKQKSSGTQFESMLALLPGASALMGAPSGDPAGVAAGGMLGGLLAKAGGMLGGNLGGAAEALGALQNAGIPLDKAAPLASGFFEQAKQVAGNDAVDSVLSQIPGLLSMFNNKQS